MATLYRTVCFYEVTLIRDILAMKQASPVLVTILHGLLKTVYRKVMNRKPVFVVSPSISFFLKNCPHTKQVQVDY